MSTKVTVLGSKEPNKELKKIEFIEYFDGEKMGDMTADPKSYTNIILISKDYRGKGYDLMYAYDDDINLGWLYIGHFNDGVV